MRCRPKKVSHKTLRSRHLREHCLLCRYPRQHALGGLNGTDNMVIFRTARYNEQPLVIQGPGAGADVTAMGVFSDLLTIAKRLRS